MLCGSSLSPPKYLIRAKCLSTLPRFARALTRECPPLQRVPSRGPCAAETTLHEQAPPTAAGEPLLAHTHATSSAPGSLVRACAHTATDRLRRPRCVAGRAQPAHSTLRLRALTRMDLVRRAKRRAMVSSPFDAALPQFAAVAANLSVLSSGSRPPARAHSARPSLLSPLGSLGVGVRLGRLLGAKRCAEEGWRVGNA